MTHAQPDDPTPELDALEDALIRADDTARHDRHWHTPAVAVLLAFAVVVVAAVASYLGASLAYMQAARHTDARIAVLEGDLSARRAAANAANANRDKQIAELRALLCVTLDHLTPRDGQVQQLRDRYQCDGGPYAPAPLPNATPKVPPATSPPR